MKHNIFNSTYWCMSYLFVQAGVFMGFSITSAVFGGIIIISYSMSIAFSRDEYTYDYDSYSVGGFGTEMVLSAIILILGIVEFAIGIWAAVCLCMMKPCTCCYGNPPQLVSHPRVIYWWFQLYNLRRSVVLRKIIRSNKQTNRQFHVVSINNPNGAFLNCLEWIRYPLF